MFNLQTILTYIVIYSALLVSLILHENAHGVAALYMGDTTAKDSGRLSLNPLKHLSPLGTLSLLIFHFGWAKPVPINPYNFRKKKLGNFLVSISGVITNFLLAFISLVIFNFVISRVDANPYLILFVKSMVQYNVLLGVFNLIPLPPLDGSKIVMTFLPDKVNYKLLSVERYTNMILIALIFTGAISKVVLSMSDFVLKFMYGLLG
ncbi:site-2 protease family protein [Lagierella massiliensis]|uniref:site-2 protease family protein n=1 Tax=Lagierella massiliensis TaxID=1689303 RepID=UPI0006D7E9CF|nr:site-2 protease family protein [Lagierella massiliensis]